VVALVSENARTQSIVLDPLDWPGHLAGQHVDVRLTAEDGYQAQRSYSIASAPEDDHLMLTVERLDAGEVSPYLTETLQPGDDLERETLARDEEQERRSSCSLRWRSLERLATMSDARPPRIATVAVPALQPRQGRSKSVPSVRTAIWPPARSWTGITR
jgi:hypothetical protein